MLVSVLLIILFLFFFVFFFNDTATTEIYTLSLHDALPISSWAAWGDGGTSTDPSCPRGDRKSTRLNSSHANISYAVFCLKKKQTKKKATKRKKKKKKQRTKKKQKKQN